MTRKKSSQLYSTPQEILNSPAGGDLGASAFATQDLATVRTQLDGINASAQTVSTSLVKAFANASASSRTFSTTLSGVTASLTQMLSSVGADMLSQGVSSILDGLTAGSGAATTVAPFADGGIIASPTFFGSGGSVGLMGERGAEAVVPLARGPNGQLGLAANGSSAGAPINVHIQTQDAESFRRSESQVAAALARAVARGRRGL